MIPFALIVSDVLGDGETQRALPYEYHPVQAFLFDRAHKALRERIQVRRSGRRTETVFVAPQSPDLLHFRDLLRLRNRRGK